MNTAACETIVYRGSSMSPTLKPTDILHVLSYRREKIQPGDVIAFIPPGRKEKVIHRVVSVDAGEIRTRGDHNINIDSWILSPDDIIGRIIWVQREKGRSIYGGWRGQLHALLTRAIRIVDLKGSNLLRPIYHHLARTGTLKRWLTRRLNIRVLSFNRPSGTELQLLMGRRVIGQLLPAMNQWQIQRPFRLFINEASLPQTKGKMILLPLSENKTLHGNNKKLKVHQMEDVYLAQSIAAVTSGRSFGPEFHPSIEFKNGFDWDYLLKATRKNGVSSLLYFYQKEEKENFPKNFFEELEKDYCHTLARNIFIWDELKPILKSLEEEEIEAILLKGIALGVTIYPSIGFRPMGDVDILIKDKDIFKVNKTLNRFGYFQISINLQDIELGKTEYLTTLNYRNKNLSLHLHRHLVNSSIPNFSYISKIDMKRIWQMARLIEIFGIKALFLSPEHLIIYLCEHSLRVTHSLSRLILLADISQAINYYQDRIDWDFLVKESYNFGLERMVYYGLYSVNKVLRIDVPFNILSILKPKRFTRGEKIFLSLLAKNRSSPGLSYLLHLAMNKRPLEKVKFLFRTLFPPKKVLAQRNCIPPSKINYLYYVSRLKEVLGHAIISILH